LYAFLREKNIRRPRELTYKDALAFLTWRTAQTRRGGKSIKLNTALNDMKVLRIVMRQAVRLGYATGNPCDRLGVAKEESKQKPEFSDADIAEIRTGLVDEPEWMTTCFEIALNTGCRLSETQIDFQHIDFKGKTLTFIHPKGGEDRAYTIPLPVAITPMLKRIKESGASHTLALPRMAGKLWWQFFGRIGRKDLCLHCARVTFVTRLHRAGVPTPAAMKLVNHSSTLVHKIYQRLKVDDLRQWSQAIVLPPAPARQLPAEISARPRRRAT
jgi:integrase